jgi:hypothetical protein
MANRPKRPRDPNQLAHMMVQLATGEIADPEPPKKDPLAVELGRRGGLKGGKARKEKLSQERRSEIAIKAVNARWAKTVKPDVLPRPEVETGQASVLTVSRSRKADGRVPKSRNRKI